MSSPTTEVQVQEVPVLSPKGRFSALQKEQLIEKFSSFLDDHSPLEVFRVLDDAHLTVSVNHTRKFSHSQPTIPLINYVLPIVKLKEMVFESMIIQV